MKKKQLLISALWMFSLVSSAQVADFKEKFELPAVVKETSGLLFIDGKIITHNDSGNSANLYELDSLTGELLRPISIQQSTNVDWEDLAEDETHIYIGDFGNNTGTRKDLKIYKISKSDFKENSAVNAELILFSYEDQTNFNSSNSHNFDAEALVVHENSLLIFTKNRGDLKTNVYKVPTAVGIYTAEKVSAANIGGLVTGATIHNNNFMLCGYDTNAIPFLVYISSNRESGDDIFNAGFDKYSLANELGVGSQVEAITSFDNGKFYISRESVNNSFLVLPQKLFEFTDERTKTLSTKNTKLETFRIYPNPTIDKINIRSTTSIVKVSLFNSIGKRVLKSNTNTSEIDISHLPKGIYLIRVLFGDAKSMIRKVIKH